MSSTAITSWAEPYIGDESTIPAPISKKVFFTSARPVQQHNLRPHELIHVPIPTTRDCSPVAGMAALIGPAAPCARRRQDQPARRAPKPDASPETCGDHGWKKYISSYETGKMAR